MSPKAKFPLSGISATKSIAKQLTYYSRGGSQKVRAYHKPSGEASAAQLAQRQIIKLRVEAWQALSPEDKASWNAAAKTLGDPWSGYTYFMSIQVTVTLFTELDDTFPDYDGLGGKSVLVRDSEDGLEANWPLNIFLDNFDDASLFWGWRTDETDAERTIVESGGVLTIAVDPGENADWWTGVNNAPKIIIGIRGFPSEFICKMNSGTFPDYTTAGMFIANNPIGTTASQSITYGYTSGGLVIAQLGSVLDQNAVSDLPIWLRIRGLSGATGAFGGRLIFSYSLNGIDWTDQYTYDLAALNYYTAGLFAKSFFEFNGLSAPFEFFKINTLDRPS